MTHRAELIYDPGCPNLPEARKALLQAFVESGLPAVWTEWDRSDGDAPPYVRLFGSPTVLVDGKDVAGIASGQGSDSCRLYAGISGGYGGAPPADHIAAALNRSRDASGWRAVLSSLSATGGALLPAGVCPACWPVYAGLMGSLGLGFLLETRYLFPIVAVFMLAALVPLAYKPRRGYRPLFLGSAGAAFVLSGKFAFSSNFVVYGGLVLFIGASFWNAWPQPAARCRSCIEKP